MSYSITIVDALEETAAARVIDSGKFSLESHNYIIITIYNKYSHGFIVKLVTIFADTQERRVGKT